MDFWHDETMTGSKPLSYNCIVICRIYHIGKLSEKSILSRAFLEAMKFCALLLQGDE